MSKPGRSNLAILLATMVIAAITMAAGAANADLIIVPNGNTGLPPNPDVAQDESQSAGGYGFPCATCSPASQSPGPGFQVTTYGYTSGAYLEAAVAGLYQFTYYGAGNAANHNTFTSTGGTFNNHGVTPSTPAPNANPSTFVEFLNAGQMVPFTLTSAPSADVNCSVTDGTATTKPGCDYLVALANSPTAPGAVGPQTTAYIGFSDWDNGATPPDDDFQDMVVRVDEIPEPASLSLMAAGLLGLGALRRRKAR